MFASIVVFSFIAPYLPGWLSNVLFLIWGVFVFLPVTFAVGPIGRRLGRSLNEAAAAQAKAEREALGQRPLPGIDREG